MSATKRKESGTGYVLKKMRLVPDSPTKPATSRPPPPVKSRPVAEYRGRLQTYKPPFQEDRNAFMERDRELMDVVMDPTRPAGEKWADYEDALNKFLAYKRKLGARRRAEFSSPSLPPPPATPRMESPAKPLRKAGQTPEMMEFLGARGGPKVMYAGKILEKLRKSGVTWDSDTGEITYPDGKTDPISNLWDLLRDAVTDFQKNPRNSPLGLVRFYRAIREARVPTFLVRNTYRHHLIQAKPSLEYGAAVASVAHTPFGSYLSGRRGPDTSTPGSHKGVGPMPQPSFTASPIGRVVGPV
jgi:hypothetical protein